MDIQSALIFLYKNPVSINRIIQGIIMFSFWRVGGTLGWAFSLQNILLILKSIEWCLPTMLWNLHNTSLWTFVLWEMSSLHHSSSTDHVHSPSQFMLRTHTHKHMHAFRLWCFYFCLMLGIWKGLENILSYLDWGTEMSCSYADVDRSRAHFSSMCCLNSQAECTRCFLVTKDTRWHNHT